MCDELVDDNGLLQIGVFSTLTRISVRMLRYYQDQGVLIPEYVDPFTGRRYYAPEQLQEANLAVQLRDAGFPVPVIARLVSSTDPDEIAEAMETRRAELARERDGLHARSVALDRVTMILKGSPHMTEVTIRTIPAMNVASLRRVMPTYDGEGALWEEIMPLLQRSGAAFPAGGISGATYHDPEYNESNVDVEVWIQVAQAFEPIAPLECIGLPGQQVVCATLTGDYSQMSAVTSSIGSYIAEHGLRTGPMFNIYRVSPAQNPDPSSWVTDVCFPILRQ